MNIRLKKQILSVLLVLTCAFGLTACGEEETITELEQQRTEGAVYYSEIISHMMVDIINGGQSDFLLDSYDNVELSTVFSSLYADYTSSTSGFSVEGKGFRTAITSFQSGLEDMGGITEYGEAQTSIDDDTITVIIPVTGANATGEIEFIYSNDIYLTMSSCSLNLDKSLGEAMGMAALNTLIGMGTVFIVLVLISLIISCFKFIPAIQAMFSKKKEEPAKEAPKAAAPVAVPVVEEEFADDTELVAVIAAAIAAYEGTSADGFRVRSIKRANTKNWKNA